MSTASDMDLVVIRERERARINQYDAYALRLRLDKAVEALATELRSISADACRQNGYFDGADFDLSTKDVVEQISDLGGNFKTLIDDADASLARALEGNETDRAQHTTYVTSSGMRAA